MAIRTQFSANLEEPHQIVKLLKAKKSSLDSINIPEIEPKGCPGITTLETAGKTPPPPRAAPPQNSLSPHCETDPVTPMKLPRRHHLLQNLVLVLRITLHRLHKVRNQIPPLLQLRINR